MAPVTPRTPDCPAAVHDSQLNTSGGGRTQDAAAMPVAAAMPADAMTGISPVSRSFAGKPRPGGPPPGRGTPSPAAAPSELAFFVATAAGHDSETGPVPAGRPSLPGSVTEPAEPGTTSPAGGALDGARGVPAGSRGLRGKEFRDAMRRAQSGRGARRPVAASKHPAPVPEPVEGGAELTATAHCIDRCEWTAGPGDPAEVDKAAEKHTVKPPKHPTAVVAGLAGIRGAG